jgi:4-amino-4-deoxy-L-arabinose transferase-like glycosyltransferase
MKPLALRGPPAVWTAFALQGRWKNWVLAGQLLLNLALVLAVLEVAQTPPDVVVVSEDGEGTFVERGVAGGALQDFLRVQRGRASDLTLLAFTQRFVRLTAAVNSSTVEEAWDEALGMMVAPLATRVKAEAEAQRMLETYRLAQVRTLLDFLSVELVERRGDKAHVRTRARRLKEKLMGGGASQDVLQVDLVLLEVPRTRAHPDGLEVLDWRSAPDATTDAGASPAASPSPAPPVPP